MPAPGVDEIPPFALLARRGREVTYLKYSEAVGITSPVSRPREVGAGDSGDMERLQRENAELRRKLEQSRA